MKKLLLTGLAGLCCVLHSTAQVDFNELEEVTSTYLIKNVHFQKSAGDSMTLTNILVRDGLIHKVGQNLQPPFDARTINADSMYAYPSFIDALSHAGILKKEEGKRPDVKFPGAPPDDIAGITPQNKALDVFNPSDNTLKDLRESGFAIAHSVPRGKMLPGKGAVISLQGNNKDAMAIRDDASVYFQFERTRGLYPSTVIGIMAKWRDLYRNAEIAAQHATLYESSGGGVARPKVSEAIKALVPLTNGDESLFVQARNSKDVFRALELQKELGHKMVLANIEQGWYALDAIRASGAPVVLSAKLPKPDKEKKKGKAEKGEKKKSDQPMDPEKEALKKRKAESLKAYESQAAVFEKAGIPFAISMMDTKGKDLKANLKRMMAAGLSEKGAMAAMTTHPASLLGISHLAGSIEEGKLANIFITDKPYFDDDAHIKYIFVDGHFEELKIKTKKVKGKEGESEEPADAVFGRWAFEVEIPGQTQTGKIVIDKNDGDYAISVTGDDDPDDVDEARDIDISGRNLTFTIDIEDDGVTMEVDFDIEVDDDTFEGTVSVGEFGSFAITGIKYNDPD